MKLLGYLTIVGVFGLIFSIAGAQDDGIVNSECPVSGKEAKSSFTVEYKGKKVGLCCNMCKRKWNEDPEKWAGNMAAFNKKEAKDETAELGKVVPNFTLKTVDGKKEVELKSFRKSKDNEGRVVVIHFWSYKCPSGKRCLPDLGEFAKFCKEKDVELLGLCAYGESAKQLAKYQEENDIDYTLLYDGKFKATKIFGAKVVTKSAIIDKNGQLVYTGAFKSKRGSPLKDALEEVLAGKKVSKAETKARG